MKKRFISSLLLSAVVAGNLSIGIAADEKVQFEHERSILEGLGFITEEISKNGDELLTRGDFAVMTANVAGYNGGYKTQGVFHDVEKEYYAADEIEYLHSIGIINGYGDGSFRAGGNITYGEAVSILLRIIGVSEHTEYYKNSYFPEKNIKSDTHELTFDMAVGYIYEAMNTEVLECDLSKGEKEYKQSEETVLEKWRNIAMLEGTVLTTGYKSVLYEGGEGVFLVDNISLHTDTPYEFDCLGKYSEIYYYTDESDFADEVVFAKAIDRFNEITIIDGDDAYYENGRIYYEENGKAQNVSIKPTAYLAKNYKPAFNTPKEQLFSINSGRVIVNKVRKNDTEVVMIEDYLNYVVSGKSEYDRKIYTDIGTPIGLEDTKAVVIKDTSGKDISFSDIENDDVVSVLTGDNYETFAEIIVSRDIATGKVSGVVRDDDRYKIHIENAVYQTVKNIDSSVLPSVGNDTSLYLNFFGKVVYTKNSKSSDFRYGYLCRFTPDEIEEDVFYAKIFADDDKMYNMEAKRKLRIDNKVYKNYTDALNALKDGTGTDSIYQPIRFKKNEMGELVEIDTEYRNISANESIYSLTPIFKCHDKSHVLDTSINGSKKGYLTYHSNSNNFEGYFIRELDSVNFRVPASYQQAENYYTAKLTFKTGGYNLDSYTINPDKLAADFIIQYSSVGAVGEKTRIGVITDVMTTLNGEDEEAIKVKIASRDNTDGTEHFISEFCPLENVPTRAKYHVFPTYTPKAGDAVIYSLNSDSEIVEISPYYVAEDKRWYVQAFVTDTYEGTHSGSGLYFSTNERFNMGCVYDVYNNNVVIALTDNKTVTTSTEKRSYTLDSGVKIYLAEERGTMREITPAELKTYKRVAGACNEIVIETHCNKPFIAVVYQ